MPLGMEVGLSPGHIVLDGDPALPPQKGAQQPPNFSAMTIVAKQSSVSATAELFVNFPNINNRRFPLKYN